MESLVYYAVHFGFQTWLNEWTAFVSKQTVWQLSVRVIPFRGCVDLLIFEHCAVIGSVELASSDAHSSAVHHVLYSPVPSPCLSFLLGVALCFGFCPVYHASSPVASFILDLLKVSETNQCFRKPGPKLWPWTETDGVKHRCIHRFEV